MRKASIALLVLLFLMQWASAQTNHVTIAGCVLNANGAFRLMTKTHTYILKGHKSELFGYNGKLVEITGTEDILNLRPRAAYRSAHLQDQ